MSTELQLAYGLSKLGALFRAEAWRKAEETGLTPTQAQILDLLLRHGPLGVSVVAHKIAVTQPTASDAVAALVRKGLVEKLPNAEDGRKRDLHPTEDARDFSAPMPDPLLSALRRLSETDRGAMLRNISEIILLLQRQNALPVQRMCVNCKYFRPNAHAAAEQPHHCDFVNASFGDSALRLDCGEHEESGPPA